jgi:hypothetical protein
MLAAKRRVIPFVKIREMDPIAIPKRSQRKTPKQKAAYIMREMALTSRVRHIFMTCGKKEKVVSVPATSPRDSVSMGILSSFITLTHNLITSWE